LELVIGRAPDIQIWARGENSRRLRVHSESRVAVAVWWGQFGNPGKETSVAGSRYLRSSEGQQTQRFQYVK
jgi:hypothetical protein